MFNFIENTAISEIMWQVRQSEQATVINRIGRKHFAWSKTKATKKNTHIQSEYLNQMAFK